jgi:hypothetical protein
MRHIRMVGLCLVAVFAIAAVAATSASALPEWGQCYVQAKHEGKYANAGCTVKAKKVSEKFTGEFEWRKGTEVAKKHFEGGNVGSGGVLAGEYIGCEIGGEGDKYRGPNCEGNGGTKNVLLGKPISVECESEHNSGEAAGAKEVKNVAVVFRGCKVLGSIPCSNALEGEIRVNTLKGTLGYINKSKKEVGVLLQPFVKHGEFTKFNCGSSIATVVGEGNEKEGCAYPLPACGGDGIISPITPVNTMTSAFTQTYTMNEKFENIPSKLEGKRIELLESYLYNAETPEYTSMWSKAGETITNANTPEEAVEIKA